MGLVRKIDLLSVSLCLKTAALVELSDRNSGRTGILDFGAFWSSGARTKADMTRCGYVLEIFRYALQIDI